ncbi:unnamed protein product [Zymoseptoria tritici ST99CH_1A5]|uniref:F-box domain-containing protein n=1 Tax=Zymoseptoria tritici ST99CH_1A5 TaxID=1276529 RepID=A0A1Y6LEZ3_ZYMTR|nr:unnamed protein product [Zymoseptoria tritici ST99CH_1A5]
MYLVLSHDIGPSASPSGKTTGPSPSQMTPDSAAARVLAIPELLELILLQLDSLPDLIRCRRVNQTFLRTINSCRNLRQVLFLEADHSQESTINPLLPTFFSVLPGYRSSTIALRVDLVALWSQHNLDAPPPLWHRMFIAQPPTTTCVIPVGSVATVFFKRVYPEGMTFGDLERAVIAAFEVRKGRRSGRERLEELSRENSVLIYWR